MSGLLSRVLKAVGDFDVGIGVAGGPSLHASARDGDGHVHGNAREADGAKWMSFSGDADEVGSRGRGSVYDDGDTRVLDGLISSDTSGIHGEGSVVQSGDSRYLHGEATATPHGIGGAGTVYRDDEHTVGSVQGGVYDGSVHLGGAAYSDDERTIGSAAGSLGQRGLHADVQVYGSDELDVVRQSIHIGQWGEEGRRRYGFEFGGALASHRTDMDGLPGGAKLKQDWGSVLVAANAGQDGGTLGVTGTGVSVAVDNLNEQHDPDPNDPQRQGRFGPNLGFGGLVRGHWSDVDKDGNRELGAGGDIGQFTGDYRSETLLGDLGSLFGQ